MSSFSPTKRSAEEEHGTPGPEEQQHKRRRKNTVRACDSCKSKKIKCDGFQPCSRCELHKKTCTYDSPYSRGLAPPVVPSAATRLSTSVLDTPGQAEPHQITESSPSKYATFDQHRRAREPTSESESEAAERFLGETSNIAYSHAAKLHLSSRPPSPPPPLRQDAPMERRNSKSNWWHLSEEPFTPLDIARYSLPDTDRGLEMSSWYFENASPTYRFLDRPSVERNICILCRSGDWLGGQNNTSAEASLTKVEECTVMMVWSLACQYPLAKNGKRFDRHQRDWLREKGLQYFQVADMLMEGEKSLIDRLPVLQVRLLQCLYLLTASRLKAAWDLFAAVKNMANNLDLSRIEGSHRAALPRQSHPLPHADRQARLHSEKRKRSFWAIYTLDTYFATMLGKMVTFTDSDIKVGYPSLSGDANFEFGVSPRNPDLLWQGPGPDDKPSLMWGPIAHAQLAKIVRKALKEMYSDPDASFNTDAADRLAAELHECEANWPDYLRLKTIGELLPIYKRQSGVIKLALQHACLLINRPSLPLSGLGLSRSKADMLQVQSSGSLLKYQDRCLEAALNIADNVSSMVQKGDITDQFWYVRPSCSSQFAQHKLTRYD